MYLQVTFLSGTENRNLIRFLSGNITLYEWYVKMCKISFQLLKVTRYNRELIKSIPSAESRSADLNDRSRASTESWDRRNASLVTNIL